MKKISFKILLPKIRGKPIRGLSNKFSHKNDKRNKTRQAQKRRSLEE